MCIGSGDFGRAVYSAGSYLFGAGSYLFGRYRAGSYPFGRYRASSYLFDRYRAGSYLFVFQYVGQVLIEISTATHTTAAAATADPSSRKLLDQLRYVSDKAMS